MNKTAVFITFASVATVSIITAAVLLAVRPDASATLIQLIGTALALIAVFAGTVYGLGKQGEKIDTIQRQTNGTNTALHAENTRLTNLLIQRGINPDADTIEARKPAHARE
ncbi:hypothetical protein [Agreia sp. VKM Ac-1783]|uniref:hypothetical protein n=1 Tax=Agreia sp. VKM Ac-1783 TaxID=1938889 RepID=UPI000A2AB9F8|nr:hypothetical protein [Agreia sp. VKM Ac-1783]SMQ73449.1 hypothetical protein SAMN06295943_2882 [Agreia sp. VKM Ac-1783]